MNYKEESYILDTLTEVLERIRHPSKEYNIKQLIREIHENNIMLKQIIKVINTFIVNSNKENENDFGRNVLANLISNNLDIYKQF